jgi:hypothetical protein
MAILTVISAKRSKSATPPYELGRQPDLRPPHVMQITAQKDYVN